jgi:hypothetical protein
MSQNLELLSLGLRLELKVENGSENIQAVKLES